jgi:hypothetical protein
MRDENNAYSPSTALELASECAEKRPGVRFLNTKASVDTAPVNWKDDVKEISFDIVMTIGFVGVLSFDPKSN